MNNSTVLKQCTAEIYTYIWNRMTLVETTSSANSQRTSFRHAAQIATFLCPDHIPPLYTFYLSLTPCSTPIIPFPPLPTTGRKWPHEQLFKSLFPLDPDWSTSCSYSCSVCGVVDAASLPCWRHMTRRYVCSIWHHRLMELWVAHRAVAAAADAESVPGRYYSVAS